MLFGGLADLIGADCSILSCCFGGKLFSFGLLAPGLAFSMLGFFCFLLGSYLLYSFLVWVFGLAFGTVFHPGLVRFLLLLITLTCFVSLKLCSRKCDYLYIILLSKKKVGYAAKSIKDEIPSYSFIIEDNFVSSLPHNIHQHRSGR